MNVHEYQAKEILSRYGVPVQGGAAVSSVEEAVEAAKRLNAEKFVVKAQIHAGGRGKGGGVILADSIEELEDAAATMLGMNLITHQTGREGKRVDKILITEAADIQRELYLGLTLNRAASRIGMIACAEGGVEIETVAAENPDAVIEERIDPAVGLMPFQANRAAYALELPPAQARQFVDIALKLAAAFIDTDASLIEINPYDTVISGLCDVALRGPSGEVLPGLVERIRGLRPGGSG